MTYRTNSGAVQGVLEGGGDYNGTTSLLPYIATANVMVSRAATCATNKGVTLTATELELMERWLAAHFYVCSDQTLAEETTERAKGVYHGSTGLYLDSSRYGQTAQSLDVSGCLAAIGKRQRVGVKWLGKRPSDQTDYVDRD